MSELIWNGLTVRPLIWALSDIICSKNDSGWLKKYLAMTLSGQRSIIARHFISKCPCPDTYFQLWVLSNLQCPWGTHGERWSFESCITRFSCGDSKLDMSMLSWFPWAHTHQTGILENTYPMLYSVSYIGSHAKAPCSQLMCCSWNQLTFSLLRTPKVVEPWNRWIAVELCRLFELLQKLNMESSI